MNSFQIVNVLYIESKIRSDFRDIAKSLTEDEKYSYVEIITSRSQFVFKEDTILKVLDL